MLTTGSYGFNFEVSGFFSLYDRAGKAHWYVNMGTEGGNVSFHESAHWALWNEGTVSRRENGSALFTPTAGGAGDWGLGYALTSFNDTKHNRRVQYAWLPEDITGDGGLFSALQQGFQGSLSLPRELFVHEVDGVTADAALVASKNAVLVSDSHGTVTAQTLGVRPLADVVDGLRSAAGGCQTLATAQTYSQSQILRRSASAHLELKATVSAATGAVGVIIGASPDGREQTTIFYEPANHTILVDRSRSSLLDGFADVTVTGAFQPYTVAGATEDIVLDVFVDGSLVEVYANERFALSTRIYPSMECSTGFGVFVEEGSTATFRSVEAWVGLKNAWPERPANSSSQLVFDTPAETNDYVWWPGM